jgi:hypothetical protein
MLNNAADCSGGNCMINTGKKYEQLAQMVFNHINNSDREGVETINVQHNVKLQGKTTEHQIDVYWEFKVGVVTHRVIVQAKDLKSKVNQGEMFTFKGALEDLPGSTGIFVTTKGFQKGAMNVALAYGIHTYELRELVDSDWDGYIKKVIVNMHIVTPICENFAIVVDADWLSESGISEEQATKGKYAATKDCFIVQDSREKRTMYDVINGICEEIGIATEKRAIQYKEETFIEFSDGYRLKIKGFQGVFGNKEYIEELKIDGGDMVDLILKNVANGESHMLNLHMLKHQNFVI